MKIFFPSSRIAQTSRTADSGQIEFSRLPIASSTVIMRVGRCFHGGLTCTTGAHNLPLQVMPIPPYSTIQQIAEGIRSKEFSPVEIVGTHLERIESCEPTLNAFVHLNREAGVQAFVAESSVLRGDPVGPLHGVPLTVKSCIDVAGWPCPAGSVLRMGYIPRQDAPLVARLKAAGAILLGNTTTPEFLMAYETSNLTHGKTSNPC